MTQHFRFYWLPVIFWAVLIFIVSSISYFPKTVEPIFSFAEFAHAFEYAVLGYLLARALKNSDRETIKNSFRLLAIICAVVYGMSDEFHQSFIPLRTPSVIDLFYDTVGAVIGQVLYRESKSHRIKSQDSSCKSHVSLILETCDL